MPKEKVLTIAELEEIIKAAPDKTLPVVSDNDYCYSGTELKKDRLELTENEDDYSSIMTRRDEDEDE